MKVKWNTVLLSCVLFTVALIGLVPLQISPIMGARSSELAQMHDGFARELVRLYAVKAIFSMAMILMGLVIVWAGYFKTIRWTWYVMFILVFGWAFFGFIMPLRPLGRALLTESWSDTIGSAKQFPGQFVDVVGTSAFLVLMFVLMVIALILPARAFFFSPRSAAAANHQS